jgi:hypothetical protein
MAVGDDARDADAGSEGSDSALVLAGVPAVSAAQALGPVPHAFIATAAASAPAEAAQALATRIGVLAEVFMVPALSAADDEGGSGGTGAADPMAGTIPVEPNCIACLAVIVAAVETAAAAAKRGSVSAVAVSEAKATLRSVLSRLAFQPHAALDTAFAVLQDE